MGKASRLAERPDFSVPPTPQGRTDQASSQFPRQCFRIPAVAFLTADRPEAEEKGGKIQYPAKTVCYAISGCDRIHVHAQVICLSGPPDAFGAAGASSPGGRAYAVSDPAGHSVPQPGVPGDLTQVI